MLVILPGLLCNSVMFTEQLTAFPQSRCIDGYYGCCSRLDEMADYALARSPERFTLFGHSMGARVAFEILRKAPERVDRLVLADTGMHGVRPGEREKRYALRDLGRAQGMEALVDAWLPPMLSDANKDNSRLTSPLREMCVTAGIEAYERQIDALLHRPDVRSVLASVQCPTLVLVGSEDVWSPVEQHREIAGLIPAAQLEVIAGAGHMMPAESPEAMNAIVEAWLQT